MDKKNKNYILRTRVDSDLFDAVEIFMAVHGIKNKSDAIRFIIKDYLLSLDVAVIDSLLNK